MLAGWTWAVSWTWWQLKGCTRLSGRVPISALSGTTVGCRPGCLPTRPLACAAVNPATWPPSTSSCQHCCPLSRSARSAAAVRSSCSRSKTSTVPTARTRPTLQHLVDTVKQLGVDVPLFTCDQPFGTMIEDGSLPELHKTGTFGSRATERLEFLREQQPTGPLMCAEFWNGWFDNWGTHHHTTDAAASAAELDALLAAGASVNIYMFHGGTNFGFTNGANDKGIYEPTITSYDYDAPAHRRRPPDGEVLRVPGRHCQALPGSGGGSLAPRTAFRKPAHCRIRGPATGRGQQPGLSPLFPRRSSHHGGRGALPGLLPLQHRREPRRSAHRCPRCVTGPSSSWTAAPVGVLSRELGERAITLSRAGSASDPRGGPGPGQLRAADWRGQRD